MYTKVKIQHFNCTFEEMKDVWLKHRNDPLVREEDGKKNPEMWISTNIEDIEHTWFLDWDYQEQWNEWWDEYLNPVEEEEEDELIEEIDWGAELADIEKEK
jgi:hypothetical protein